MSERGPARQRAVRDARLELDEMLEVEMGRLKARREDLLRARRLLESVGVGGATGASAAFESLPFESAADVVADLLRQTTGEMRNLILVLDQGPALDDRTMRSAQDRMIAGAVHRTIYPAQALNLPAALQWVRSWGAVGEQQRLAQVVPTEFAVFGTDAVIGLARWGDLNSGYTISRHPLVIDVHAAYFDLLWAHSQPMSLAIGERQDDNQLLEYLGLGLKDEAIARLLGLGLRTVRRRIAGLMAVHGVETRYQLGVSIGHERAGASAGAASSSGSVGVAETRRRRRAAR